jgi:hypothetical protein
MCRTRKKNRSENENDFQFYRKTQYRTERKSTLPIGKSSNYERTVSIHHHACKGVIGAELGTQTLHMEQEVAQFRHSRTNFKNTACS